MRRRVHTLCRTALLACLLANTSGCSLRGTPTIETRDGAVASAQDTRAQITPVPDARTTRPPDARPPKPDAPPSGPVCPTPCPAQHDCVTLFPSSTSGICLERCSNGGCSGGCGGGPTSWSCSQCVVKVSGVKYCLDFCWWKGSSKTCPDPNHTCLDVYGIPNNFMWPGYPGSKVCVPK
jgi:hypothetical protein